LENNVALGAYILILAIFLGAVMIMRVPPTLHTPLMSATNMISGIVLVGAMVVLGSAEDWWIQALAFIAVAAASANVVGGYFVTDRMLAMFRQRTPAAGATNEAEQQR
jgi:H+-translocating NAD(P) transhydrogenase subunit alpha